MRWDGRCAGTATPPRLRSCVESFNPRTGPARVGSWWRAGRCVPVSARSPPTSPAAETASGTSGRAAVALLRLWLIAFGFVQPADGR
jgi:hypothetical protein